MTPQLLQAIKLLQLSTVELAAYVDAELERNPLLERADDSLSGDPPDLNSDDAPPGASAVEGADWAAPDLETSRGALEANLDTDLGNAFPDEAPAVGAQANNDGLTVAASVWTGVGGGGHDADGEGFEQTVA